MRRYIADMAYECPPYSKEYTKCGALFQVSDSIFKLRIDTWPIVENIIGLCLCDPAPYVEGDLFIKKEKVGHIHSQQNETGSTIYFAKLNAEPREKVWAKIIE